MARNTELSRYRYYLRIERKMSPNTVASYCSDIRKLLESTDTAAVDIQPQELEEYLGSISGSVSKRSQARILSSFRSFFSWLILDGERKENPCDRLDSPKLGRYLPEVLSVEEVERIMDSVDTSSATEIRSFFNRCDALEVIDVSWVKIPQITNTTYSGYFFYDCKSFSFFCIQDYYSFYFCRRKCV